MKYLNIRTWGSFYILGLLLVLYLMWTVEAIRPQGLALFLGTFLILVLGIFNIYVMYSEVKAHEEKYDKNRELSGLEPLPKKKFFSRKKNN